MNRNKFTERRKEKKKMGNCFYSQTCYDNMSKDPKHRDVYNSFSFDEISNTNEDFSLSLFFK